MMQFAELCVILCVGLHYVAGASNYGYVYSREVDAWLRLHMVPDTWAEAGMRCLLEGGVLASPTTSNMASVMAAMMAEQQLTSNVYTGINSIQARENFTSIEGVPLSSIPLGWAPGQPDNANWDENCIALTAEGKLADVSCYSMLPYFCRKESKCGPKNNGYEWEPRTGSCYKFHGASKTWLEALDICHTEGGHLAIINSNTESTVLKDIFAKYSPYLTSNANSESYAFIGFKQWEDGQWATIYGTKLADAGFEQWAEGEPNNYRWPNEYEDCGSIYKNGLLNDAPCLLPYPFICEIAP